MAEQAQDAPLTQLLRKQDGLLSFQQATRLGMSAAAITRRTRSGAWRRVLPRVYATFSHDLSQQQRMWAAGLYAGRGSRITGTAALGLHGISRLPKELPQDAIQVECANGSQPRSRDFVRIQRTARGCTTYVFDGLHAVSLARACVDAATLLSAYEPTLDLLTAVVASRKTSLHDVRDELRAARSGSHHLRTAVLEALAGARSAAEARARKLFAGAGLPAPAVNEPIEVGGLRIVPDFRWGRLIVEIDSREWHLLQPGSWEATMARRAHLEAHGYRVVPLSPQLLRDSPALALAAVTANWAHADVH